MRNINPGWTTAQWGRLTLFQKGADYGVLLDPARTAPFSFRESIGGGVDIVLDNVHIGEIVPQFLRVRDGFPERFDFAILRAVNALREVNDEIGRLERARKREEKTAQEARARTEAEERAARPVSWLLIEPPTTAETLNNRVESVDVLLDEDFVRRGLFGLAYADGYQNIRVISRSSIAIIVPHPTFLVSNASVYFDFDPEGAVSAHTRECRAVLNPAGFESALRIGAERWDARIDPEALFADLAEARALPKLDVHSLDRLWRMPEAEEAPKELTIGRLSVRQCPKYAANYEAFHNGQFLMDFGSAFYRGKDSMVYAGPDIGGRGLDEEDKGALIQMTAHLRCGIYGIDPASIAELSEEMLEKRVEATDFGYLV